MPLHPSPTYQRLRQYIAERMRMSPLVQPLMLLEPALGEKLPGASKIQAADQLFDRAAHLAGGISGQPHVTACLASQCVAMALEALSKELAVDLPRNPHRASSSCLT